ncbi:MAG: hypothetical protein NT069_17380 [Planctomycetota bacterium]|nr:hypothetical protein [Planctomycetota bacterium]
MAKIKIDDLPMLESLTPDEVKGIFGGTDPTIGTTPPYTPSTDPNAGGTGGTGGTGATGGAPPSGGTGSVGFPGPGTTDYTQSTHP